MKKIKRTIIAMAVAAVACGYFSINSTNEVICSNVEALTEQWDGRTLKPYEHVGYHWLNNGGDCQGWTFEYEDHKPTGKCQYVWGAFEKALGVCVVPD